MNITIDGPAGSGKSTAARRLAAELGIAYLDTGAMYRAVALAAMQNGLSLENHDALVDVAARSDIAVDCGAAHTRVTLDGVDVSLAIRSMAVDQATPFVARIPEIRRLLVDKQRAIGRKLGSLVSEGRDQGSVVFPDADIKFFLDARIEKRAQRRYEEMVSDGEDASYGPILENLRLRDGNDEHQWAPLLTPQSAIRIDTTQMTLDEVVERLVDDVRRRTPCDRD